MQPIRDWFSRHFSNPQVVILLVFLALGFAIIFFMGDMLAPVLASIVIAYLLEGLLQQLERVGFGRTIAVLIVMLLFILVVMFVVLWLMPLLSNQITQLVQQLPNILGKGQDLLLRLPERYPEYVSESQVREMITGIRGEVAAMGQHLLTLSWSSVVGLLTIIVYVILVPLLVFFFLKDKYKIIAWARSYFPSDMELTRQVWGDVDKQIGNYVRGKIMEILIVTIASYVTFALMGLQFAMLLAALVGLSVIIPYIGAVVVTLPVALIAYFQWGWSGDFMWLMVAYFIIQAIDGNVIVPLLFSEVVNLHPIAIIVAVLGFGGLWGFWGVFFAIPLATLVQAILTAWPKRELLTPEDTPSS